MSDAPLLVERENGVGWVRINKPERLNAFSGTMREDLEAILADFEHDHAIRCVVITGAGRAFSTGGDITVMSEVVAADDIARFEHLVRAGAAIVRRINSMSKPVLAAVNGPAAGAGACCFGYRVRLDSGSFRMDQRPSGDSLSLHLDTALRAINLQPVGESRLCSRRSRYGGKGTVPEAEGGRRDILDLDIAVQRSRESADFNGVAQVPQQQVEDVDALVHKHAASVQRPRAAPGGGVEVGLPSEVGEGHDAER